MAMTETEKTARYVARKFTGKESLLQVDVIGEIETGTAYAIAHVRRRVELESGLTRKYEVRFVPYFWHPDSGWKRVNSFCDSLEDAVMRAIAVRFDGANTTAPDYIARMVGYAEEGV